MLNLFIYRNNERYGSLEYYDKTYDRVTTRHDRPLKRINRTYYRVTTTDDPIIQKVQNKNKLQKKLLKVLKNYEISNKFIAFSLF